MNQNKIKFLKFQFGTAIVLFVVIFLSGFFVLGPDLGKIAKAITGNYSKNDGDTLGISDWNNLDDDFVVKSGDTMTGPLTLSADPSQEMEAATKQYVDNNAGSGSGYVDVNGFVLGDLDMQENRVTNLGAPNTDNDAVSRGFMNDAITSALSGVVNDVDIQDTSGEELRMVCGSTIPGASGWVNTGRADACSLTVSFPDVGFSSSPNFFTSLEGANTYRVIGSTSIYNKTTTGFRILIVYREDPLPDDFDCVIKAENEWNWIINWCAVGN